LGSVVGAGISGSSSPSSRPCMDSTLTSPR
jgi:hypothetical protein